MITSLYVAGCWDNFATTLELDVLPFPLQKFEWPQSFVGDAPRRHQQAGSWKAPKNAEEMPVDMEGEIVQDTTANYWTSRKNLLKYLIPPRNNTNYDHVKFLLTVDGDATQYYAFAVLDDYSAPLEATGAPTVSQIQFHFSCREGYWRKVSDNTYVIL